MASRKWGNQQPADTEQRSNHPQTHVHLRFESENANSIIAPRIVDELASTYTVLEADAGNEHRQTACTLDIVLADEVDLQPLQTALTELNSVSRCRIYEIDPVRHETTTTTETKAFLRTTDRERDAHDVFKELQSIYAAEDPGSVLQDPEYIDFLDSFDQLTDSLNDDLRVEDLLEEASTRTDDTQAIATTADSTTPMTDQEESDDFDIPVVSSTDDATRDTAPESEASAEDPDRDPSSDTDASPESTASERTEERSTPAATESEDRPPLVAQLIHQLQSDDVDEAHRRELRDALGVQSQQPLQTQLNHLQSRLSQFEAYADALENFLDEHGDGQQLIEEFSSELERTQAQITDLREQIQKGSRERSELRNELDRLEERIDEVDHNTDVDALADRIDTVETDLEATADDFEAELSTVQDQVETLDEWRTRIVDAVQADRDPAPESDREESPTK